MDTSALIQIGNSTAEASANSRSGDIIFMVFVTIVAILVACGAISESSNDPPLDQGCSWFFALLLGGIVIICWTQV